MARNKGVMLTKIGQSGMTSYSLADVTKDLIHRMIPLNGGPNLSWNVCGTSSYLSFSSCAHS
jgi:hypothetical protein